MLELLLQVLGAVIATGVAVLFYATVIERNWFALRRHRVPCLPPGSAPVRILHISDLHLRRQQQWKQRWLRGLAKVKPDLLIATGDMMGDVDAVDAVLRSLRPIPRARALLVLGSNDYYGPRLKNPIRYFIPSNKRGRTHGPRLPWTDLVAGLEADGWDFINNRVLDVDGIDVLGLDDAHIHRAKLSLASPRTHDGFRMVVAHSPDVVKPLAPQGYDLILCGHTHGGQLRIPGYGALVTNCDLPRKMARGLHQIGDTWLHVCGGLGTSKYAPFRFACRPEACVLELVPRAPEGTPR